MKLKLAVFILLSMTLINLACATDIASSANKILFKNVQPGAAESATLIFSTNNIAPITIDMYSTGEVGRWVNFESAPSFELSKAAPSNFKFNIHVPENTPQGLYTGDIIIDVPDTSNQITSSSYARKSYSVEIIADVINEKAEPQTLREIEIKIDTEREIPLSFGWLATLTFSILFIMIYIKFLRPKKMRRHFLGPKNPKDFLGKKKKRKR